MNNFCYLVICLIWACSVCACPQWGSNTPCTCSETKDGIMVQCTGPSRRQQVIAALKNVGPVNAWDLQLDALDLEELPSTVRTVSSFRLTNCNLDRLQKVTPLVWPRLTEVVFESVRMEHSPWAQLKGAHRLKSLKVSDFSMMRTIGQNFRSVPISVEYLDLRKTGTTKLEPGCMAHLKNLRYVFFADMPLTDFPRDALPEKLPQLHTFILGNTLIEKLVPSFFEGMPKLEVLMLNGNKFSTLDSHLFMPLRNHLTHLVAERNPLECECDLLWLKQNLQNVRTIKVLATCYDSSTREFKEVMKLNENEYCT